MREFLGTMLEEVSPFHTAQGADLNCKVPFSIYSNYPRDPRLRTDKLKSMKPTVFKLLCEEISAYNE